VQPNRIPKYFRNALALTVALLVFNTALSGEAFWKDDDEWQPSSFAARCIGKACFDSSSQIGGEDVPLRGLGSYEFLKIDLFTAAFYVPDRVIDVDELLGNSPKRLVICYQRGFKKEEIVSAAENALKKNPELNLTALRPRLEQMYQFFQNVHKGDRYELVFEPRKGTALILNGEYQGVVPGEDFARAFFGIWISNYSISYALKRDLCSFSRR